MSGELLRGSHRYTLVAHESSKRRLSADCADASSAVQDGNGSIAGAGGTYNTPDGTSRNIWHCRPVSGNLNFALSGRNVTVAQFPARIVATSGSDTVTANRPSTTRNISGGRATRADYTVAAGTLTDVFAQGNTITVQLFDA